MLSKNISIYRKESGLTTEEFAKRCGLPHKAIVDIESGSQLPRAKDISKLASALGVKNNIVLNWYLEDTRKTL